MESRRVYRGIEDLALRGKEIRIEHIHSVLALNLRYQYRELMDARDTDMRYGMALAAIYAHPRADIKSGIREINRRFDLAKSCIPYYNIRVRNANQDIERGVRLLRLLHKNVTKEMLESDA